MRRIAAALAVVVLGTGCGSGGVSDAEHELVVSALAVANQDLALAKEQLASAEQRVVDAVADRRSAEESVAAAGEEIAELRTEIEMLQDEIESLFTIDEAEGTVMERQQSLAMLGNFFVEFRSGPWDAAMLEMFREPVMAAGNERIVEQFERFAAGVAVDPGSAETDYEYGVLGFEIMSALEAEVVDPFGGS